MKKYLILGVIIFLMLIAGVIRSLWLVYAYLPARNIQQMIDAPNWKEFKYEKLGYSFIAPADWTTEEIEGLDKNGYRESEPAYKVSTNAYPKTLINVIFYKDPEGSMLESLLDGHDPRTQVDPKPRNINGIEYTVIHYPPRLNAGYKAGNYLLAKDRSLLIEARAAWYPSEISSLEMKKEEELVNKILNSVKRI